jgi:hypothetical protein
MPRHCNAVLELGAVLRMEGGANSTARAIRSAGGIEVNS